MPKLFISYRRDDSAYAAQHIRDKLADHYGKESVVFDVDTIPKGFDFVEYLNQQVSECDVLLAVIGDQWLDVRAADGSRRIDNANDWVHIEIDAALKREIPVIPVLVGNCSIPLAASLPDDLKPLSRRNATEVRPGRDLQTHLERLVKDIEDSLKYVALMKLKDSDVQKYVSQTLMKQPKDFEVRENSIGMKMVLLPAGEFLMGSPDSDEHAFDEEKPQHSVRITQPFLMSIYPVTQQQYSAIGTRNPSKFSDDLRRPVEKIDWREANMFCNRLSQHEDLPLYYDIGSEEVTIVGGVGYRLPTEAEWEYACRAGSDGDYCFGDDLTQLAQYAWFKENSKKRTHLVGEKRPNAWGLCDMHGNVWEWCWDWFDRDYYRTSPKENPIGPPLGSHRVLRGGSWFDGARSCRSAYRGGSVPEGRDGRLGFRLARNFVQQDKPGSGA